MDLSDRKHGESGVRVRQGGGGVEEKFRRGVLGRKGGVYMDMMWVAGLWFSWECEGESGRIMEVSECLVEKCGHYSIADGKPRSVCF